LKCIVCKRNVEQHSQDMERCSNGVKILLRQPCLREKSKAEQFCCNCARDSGWTGHLKQACNQCRVRDGEMTAEQAASAFRESNRNAATMMANRTGKVPNDDSQRTADKLFEPDADISKWDLGKVLTTLDDIDANENTKAERLVIHYTTLEVAPLIKSLGFRASEYGQGGGGVYFAKAFDETGVRLERYGERTFSKKYFEGLNKELFGPNAANRDPPPVMIVCGVRKDFLDPVPMDKSDPRYTAEESNNNLVYFKLSKLRDLFEPASDGFFYLPMKTVKVKRVFRIA